MDFTVSCTNHPHYGYISVTSHYIPDGTITLLSYVIIKRKIVGENLFTSVYQKRVNTDEDLDFTFKDRLCRNNYTYQYQVEYRSVAGVEYTRTATVKSEFDVLVVCDANAIWKTPLNVSAIGLTTVKPFAINTPIYAKKPSYYSNTATNYEEGTCTGIFIKMTGPENKITFDTDHNWKYRKDFKNFITQGNAKVIKSVSGEMWLVGIKSDSITDNSLFANAEIEGARQLEFGWLEIGDVDSEQDLYENGLINVYKQFWSGQ